MAADVFDRVFSQGCLCDVKISYWTGARQFSAKDLGVDDALLPDSLYTLGKRCLVDRDEIRTFTALETAARREVRRNGFAFPVGGSSFVPADSIEPLNAKLRGLRDRWNDAVTSILDRYDLLRVDMLSEWSAHLSAWRTFLGNGNVGIPDLEELMDRVRAMYPPLSVVREKFAFRWTFFSVSFGGGPSFGVESQVSVERKAILDAHRASAEAEIREWLSDIVRDVKASTLAVVESWRGMLGRDATITSASVNALVDYVRRYRSLNFVGDRDLEAAIKAMEEALPAEVEAIKGDDVEVRDRISSALNGLETAAKAAGQNAVTEIVDRFTGESGRKVRRKVR